MPKKSNKPAKREPMPHGRPTKYRVEYCEMLIKHMSTGLSFETFGAVIGVDRSTVFDWARDRNRAKYPGFSDAKKMAQDKCRLWWEKIGIGLATGREEVKNGNTAVWIFNMKCRFPDVWKPRKEISIGDRYNDELVELSKMSAEQLAEKARQAAEYLEDKISEDDVIDI